MARNGYNRSEDLHIISDIEALSTKESIDTCPREDSVPAIYRRQFIQATGAGGIAGLAGQVSAVPADSTNDKQEILAPDMGGLTYWENLMFCCLEGLANRDSTRIIHYYPKKSTESWYDEYPSFPVDKRVFYNWYKQYSSLEFVEFDDPYQLFEKLDPLPFEGYVIVDATAPITANIAANYAGSENLLPVTETLLRRDNLPNHDIVYDLRGEFKGKKFRNMTRIEVYEWAFDHQWPDANHARVANLGTPKPAEYPDYSVNAFFTSNRSRDYTVAENGFFFDLTSAGGAFPAERELKGQILNRMEPRGYVFGWHTPRGSEGQHIRQLSNYGQLAIGASTYASNFSFHSRLEVPGAVQRFKQEAEYSRVTESAEDKIYVMFVLSDGDSLNFLTRRAQGGQWLLDARGEIPFGWEMAPVLTDLGQGILDYFQATATDNDYFTVGPSGMGYFYPEAMPTDLLEGVLNETRAYLEETGLSAQTVMNPPDPVDDETAQLYQELVGEQLTGVMEGYVRRSADTERLFRWNPERSRRDAGPSDHASSPDRASSPDHASPPIRLLDNTAWVPTSYPTGTETVDAMVKGIETLAERRLRRPLFVPVHVPAHTLTIEDMATVVNRLDSDVFEVVSPDAFYSLFAQVRPDTILLRPPEGFAPNKQILRGGAMNEITYRIQSFDDERRKITVQLRLTLDSLDDPITSETEVTLQPREVTETISTIDVPELNNGDGRLDYSIDGNNTIISVPIQPLSQMKSK
jgi:hypothetical protein